MIAADINGDGETEILAADTRGTVAAFTPRGKEVWERHLASLIAQVHCCCSHRNCWNFIFWQAAMHIALQGSWI